MNSAVSRRLLFALLVATTIAPAAVHGRAYPRLGEDVAPIAESIALDLDPARADYHGTVRVELEVRKPTPVIRFHARGQELADIALADASGKAVAVTVGREDDIAVLTAPQPLAAGRYRLSLSFTQKFNTQAVALYKAEFQGAPYLFTQLEATEAREAFPCWDEPGFKIPWSVTVTIPDGQTAVSNMPIEKDSAAGGKRTLVFATSPPMPSYLVALAVGTLETVPVPGTSMPTRIVTAKGQGALAGVMAKETPAIVAALERYFGRPYPYPKLDLIAVPEFAYGAMENAGAIVFLDRLLLADPARVGPADLRLMVAVTAHEIAHMWFGDLVTMHWWDDFWLNESFADWMADKISAEVHPELDFALDEVDSRGRALAADARPSAMAIRPEGEATPDLAMQNVGQIYAKGSAVLSMVEHWIGEDAFRRGVLDYLKAHEWRNATGPDLWNALGKAAGKDVAGVLTGFIVQSGAPLLNIEPVAQHRYGFRQARYAPAGVEPPATTWRVPLGLRYRDQTGVHEWSGEMASATLEVTLPATGEIAWLQPNAEAAGYYRYALPQRELDALLAARDELSPAERIGLVSNLDALLLAGALPGDRYLDALGRLVADPEPAVTRAVTEKLAAAHEFVPSEARGDYAAFLRRALAPQAAALGWRPAPGELISTTLLRPMLLALVGDEGEDPALRAEARRLAQAALAEAGAVDESVADTVFALAAKDGDRALFDAYRARFEGAASPGDRQRFLAVLGRFGNPTLAQAALDYSLSDAVRPTEMRWIYLAVGTGSHREDMLFDWLTKNYSSVADRMPPFMRAFMPFAASGCSAERWKKAEAFFAEPAHRAPGIEQQLLTVGDTVKACVRLREREGEAVERWLAGQR